MAAPLGALGGIDLEIPSYRNASLTAIFERTEEGHYTFNLTFGGAYSVWTGKVDIPEADVSQKLRTDFEKSYDAETDTKYIKLNPVMQGDVEFGNRVLSKTRQGQFTIALKMTVDGKQHEGKAWVPNDDAEIRKIIDQALRFVDAPECDA